MSDGLSNVELQRLLSSLRLGQDFNPCEVIYTPSDDPGRTTTPISVRMHKDLYQAVKDVSGRGTRFQDASTFIRHAIALTLKVEQALFPEESIYIALMPKLAWIDQENERINLEALDNLITSAVHTVQSADGAKHKQAVLNRLHNMFTYCSQQGYSDRMDKIRAILERYEDR